jgi:dTDP-4-dehydrorhamnose reductase
MEILVTGVSGLLGLNVASATSSAKSSAALFSHPPSSAPSTLGTSAVRWGIYKSHRVAPPDVQTFSLDLIDRQAILSKIQTIRPQAILHTAGMTNVDACENDPLEAERQNVTATENVAHAAKAVSAKLIHISTDHLSDGTKAFVTEEALPSPLNEYARTKLMAEEAVGRICPNALIIRTNFFGWGTPFKTSFSNWILDGLKQGKEVPLFVDVFITAILINDLLDVILELLEKGATGIFNVVGSERVSKHQFGVQLAKTFGYPVNGLRPVSVKDIHLRAPRPLDMSLSTDKVTKFVGKKMPSLDESLKRLKQLGEEKWPEILRQAIP